MRESDIELVDKLTRAFGAGEPIDPKSAHKRTRMSTVEDWADRLHVLASSGLLRLRSRGALENGCDAEYGLVGNGSHQLNSDQIARAQSAHVKSDAIATTLRRMIECFGERHFTFKEAKEATRQKGDTIIAANSLAQRRGWMSMGAAGRYRFYPEKIPPEWKGETTDVASAGKNQGKSPKVQASQFRVAIRLLIKLYWSVVEFRIKDIVEVPAFRAFDALDAGEFMDEAEEKGFVINLDPGRDRRRRFRIHRENRKVQEIAMAVSAIPGEEKLGELMAAINVDSDFVGVLLLELEHLGAARQADGGWVRITNGVAEAIRSLYGWRKEDAHDLLLELVLDRLAAVKRDKIEMQKLDDGVRIFRPRVVAQTVAPEPLAVPEPEPVSVPAPVAEPEPVMVEIENPQPEPRGKYIRMTETEGPPTTTVGKVRLLFYVTRGEPFVARDIREDQFGYEHDRQLLRNFLSRQASNGEFITAPKSYSGERVYSWKDNIFTRKWRAEFGFEREAAPAPAPEPPQTEETPVEPLPAPEPAPAPVAKPEPQLQPEEEPTPTMAVAEALSLMASQDTVDSLTAEEAALERQKRALEEQLEAVRRRRQLLEFAIKLAFDTERIIGESEFTPAEMAFVKEVFLRHLSIPIPATEA